MTQRYLSDPYLRERFEGSVTGFIIEGAADSVRKARGLIGARRNYQDAAMFMTRMMDNTAISTIWRAAEIKVNAQRRLNGLKPLEVGSPELNAQAGAIARKVVTRTQPTYDALHTSALGVEAKTSFGAKLFTPFRSQPLKNMSLGLRMWHEAKRGHMSKAAAAGFIAQTMVIQSMMMAAVGSAINWLVDAPEDEEEAWNDFLKSTVKFTFSNPLLFSTAGDVINAAIDPENRPFPRGVNPALEAPVDLARGSIGMTMAIMKGEEEAFLEASLDTAESSGMMLGWPIVWPLRTLRRIIRNQESGEVIR